MTVRAVLDTNILVSGLGWPGNPAQILDRVASGKVTLVTSPVLLDELRRVLRYPRLAPVFPDPDELAQLIEDVGVVVTPERVIQAVSDEADNRVLEAAVTGSATFIVTGDKRLLSLRQFEGIDIVTAATFCELLDTEASD